jgi:hypothetical protein
MTKYTYHSTWNIIYIVVYHLLHALLIPNQTILLLPYILKRILRIVNLMSESSQTQTQQETGNYVGLVFYKVPNKFHNEIVQINKESFELFKRYGILKYEVFQLNKGKTWEGEGEGMESFTNITNLIPVSQEEELWVEVQSYRDTAHAKEMMAKCEKDERMQPLYKQFMDIIVPGSKVVMGDFSRLNL